MVTLHFSVPSVNTTAEALGSAQCSPQGGAAQHWLPYSIFSVPGG